MRVTAGKRNTEGQASSPTPAEQKESRRVAAVSSSTSPFGQNEWLVEEMYRKFREDPSSVDPSWHEFLVDYSPEATAGASKDGGDGRASAPSAPREPGPAPAPKAAAANGAPAKAEQAPAKAESAQPKADPAPAKRQAPPAQKPPPAAHHDGAPPAGTQPPAAKTDVTPAKSKDGDAKPATPKAEGDEAQIRRCAAASVVK